MIQLFGTISGIIRFFKVLSSSCRGFTKESACTLAAGLQWPDF